MTEKTLQRTFVWGTVVFVALLVAMTVDSLHKVNAGRTPAVTDQVARGKYVLGMDFMTVRTEYVSFWIFWVFASGLLLFLPGVVVFLWDFLAGKPAAQPVAA